MENYKEKYEEALEIARKINSGEGVAAPKDWSMLEVIFPELKKSENEIIIEELIDFLNERIVIQSPTETKVSKKWISWLEKQSGKTKSISEIVSTEQNPEINDDVLSRFSFYQYDDDILYLSNVFVEECNRKRGYGRKILKAAEEVAKTFGISKIRLKVESNTWMEEWYKRNGYVYLISEGKYDWLEKQSEQNKQNFWEKCNHCEYFDGYDLCLHKKNFGSVTNESKENCKNNKFFIKKQGERKQNVTDIISDLENYFATTTKEQQEKDWDEIKKWTKKYFNHNKYIEQNQTDKAEPKFKIGDWIVLEDSLNIYKIVEVCKSWYEVISNNDGMQYSIGFDEEDDCRLWSIDDTKDGDVLSTKKGNPFIYDKNRYNNGLAYYYAAIDANEELTLKNPHNMLSHFGELRSVFPATKEQRDLLFKKMKEAGYRWDSNKKELIRYEQ